MSPATKRATEPPRPAQEDAGRSTRPVIICLAAWLVPGAGHILQGRLRSGAIFFVVLLVMFISGIAFDGRLFPFQLGDPLVFLAAGAQWALGLPRIVAAAGGFGEGRVVAATYEYGNTFLIVGGLLNCLVILDAFDIAGGRKGR
jgi:hypothetical protein